jgi:hypothetical protein
VQAAAASPGKRARGLLQSVGAALLEEVPDATLQAQVRHLRPAAAGDDDFLGVSRWQGSMVALLEEVPDKMLQAQVCLPNPQKCKQQDILLSPVSPSLLHIMKGFMPWAVCGWVCVCTSTAPSIVTFTVHTGLQANCRSQHSMHAGSDA